MASSCIRLTPGSTTCNCSPAIDSRPGTIQPDYPTKQRVEHMDHMHFQIGGTLSQGCLIDRIVASDCLEVAGQFCVLQG